MHRRQAPTTHKITWTLFIPLSDLINIDFCYLFWNLLKVSTTIQTAHLLAHALVKHSSACILSPGQTAPPPEGSGFEQERVRCRKPSPHVTSHPVQDPQPVHPPSTVEQRPETLIGFKCHFLSFLFSLCCKWRSWTRQPEHDSGIAISFFLLLFSFTIVHGKMFVLCS